MNKNELLGGLAIWIATVVFCQLAFGAEVPAPGIDSNSPGALVQPVTHKYKLVPVTLEDGTPSLAIKPRNKVSLAAENTVDWVRAQGKKHRKIVWTGRTAVNVGLKVCAVAAAFKH